MTYTLITRNGRVMQFFIQAVAVMYQSFEGGVVVTNDIFINNTIDNSVTVCYNTL